MIVCILTIRQLITRAKEILCRRDLVFSGILVSQKGDTAGAKLSHPNPFVPCLHVAAQQRAQEQLKTRGQRGRGQKLPQHSLLGVQNQIKIKSKYLIYSSWKISLDTINNY